MVVIKLLSKDIEGLKLKLYSAIDHGDKKTMYDISVELDMLIVEFYRNRPSLS